VTSSSRSLIARLTLALALFFPCHQWRDGVADTALFLDLDLSILGARPERYDAYVAQVRGEYAFVPEQTFVLKRRELLRAWLARSSLYFTDVGRTRFEAAARDNIARELAR
jgi:predicted metal-dependent HD superfamily phosphohydrolase